MICFLMKLILLSALLLVGNLFLFFIVEYPNLYISSVVILSLGSLSCLKDRYISPQKNQVLYCVISFILSFCLLYFSQYLLPATKLSVWGSLILSAVFTFSEYYIGKISPKIQDLMNI